MLGFEVTVTVHEAGVAFTAFPVQMSAPVAVTVSVLGPQVVGVKVNGPKAVAVWLGSNCGIVAITPSSESVTVTFSSGTLPQFRTVAVIVYDWPMLIVRGWQSL